MITYAGLVRFSQVYLFSPVLVVQYNQCIKAHARPQPTTNPFSFQMSSFQLAGQHFCMVPPTSLQRHFDIACIAYQYSYNVVVFWIFRGLCHFRDGDNYLRLHAVQLESLLSPCERSLLWDTLE